ncbi:MAG TPA: GNAT family N-acetyltransferase [Alphaproteobacteria bacterium]|nr:GNAT family N-acetyltransferase [Alphaproteobacteria bacterium]
MNAATVRVVPAGAAHLALLSALHGACFEEGWDAPSIGRLLAIPGSFALLAGPAAEEDLPAGFTLARLLGEECEIISIGVLPERRRQGIAAALLATLRERARADGAEALVLEVAVDNAAALALYAREGFAVAGRRPAYYAKPGTRPVDAHIMRLDL